MEANTDAFPSWNKQQAELNLSLSGVNSRSSSRFERALHTFVNYTSHHPLHRRNSTVSFPFIYSTFMASYDFVVDRYLDGIRDLFELDQAKAACCSLKPDPDETVFVSAYGVQSILSNGSHSSPWLTHDACPLHAALSKLWDGAPRSRKETWV